MRPGVIGAIAASTAAREQLADVTSASFKMHLTGTHRSISPEETLSRVRPFFGPLGITRVANVTGLDCVGIPVVMVCRPNGRSLSVSQGKGLDLACAKASGVMEAIELYHAERVTRPLKLASYNDLRFTDTLIKLDELPITSSSQFHPDHPLLWIEGEDLLGGPKAWLPYELVHMNYTLPLPTGSGCFVMSSNGLASGNDMLEALVHALCEVIERDAASVFRCGTPDMQHECRLDPDTIDDGDCRRLLEAYERAGLMVGLWDISSDVGVATFRCVVMERDANQFRIFGPAEGFGCHPTRGVALLRSLTEAAQGRLTLIAGSRDDNLRGVYAETRDTPLLERARTTLARSGARTFQATPTADHLELAQDLVYLLERLRRAGVVHAYAFDLSKPEFAVSVVRVVLPGLETYHHVPGYVPGRRARSAIAQAARKCP